LLTDVDDGRPKQMRVPDTDGEPAPLQERAKSVFAKARSELATIPNVLSILRLASVPVFIWLFVTGHEMVAVYIYGTAAFTDFVDGYIARALDQVTEIGKLLDPLADRVFVIALAVALVIQGSLPWWLATIVVGRDAIVLIMFPFLERRGMPRLPVNLAGKTATAWLLFGLSWLAVYASNVTWAIRPVGLLFIGLGAAAYWVSGFMYFKEMRVHMRDEAAPKGEVV
jgi:cardiolipin synthase